MCPSDFPDGSLYDAALAAEPPLALIQVNPTGFKALIRSFIDFLIEQQISAIFWVKLPRSEAWQEELDRYLKHPKLPQGAYYLSQRKPVPQPESAEIRRTAYASNGSAPWDRIIPPTSKNRLKGEYVLLVYSQEFVGLLLARRFRNELAEDSSKGETPKYDKPSSAALRNNGHGPEATKDGKQYLKVICSVDPKVIQLTLQGIRQTVQTSAEEHPEIPAISQLLTDWEQHFPASATESLNPATLDRFFGWQLQRQEQMRHNLAAYRKQALNSSDSSPQSSLAASSPDNQEASHFPHLKKDFLNTVGQELRTPLTTIKTALTLLASPSLKSAQRQRYLDMISSECDRQSSLIGGVLNLLQIESHLADNALQPLRLIDTVPGVVSTYQPLAREKGIMLAYTVPETLPPVACLESWLKQIVINLLHNSIKYTNEGGQVWVTAKPDQDSIQLEFRDTGIGIPGTDLPKIFDYFYRGRQPISGEPEGAGLGLTIVQQFLQICGGSISAKSQPGEGTTVTVQLPIYQQTD
ncbi:MAG: ATP-binding protein [Leptolyngbyaceae cyanobacterium MO_188.B28]|nr:ATP-binding protein [Leptolyngbyaceae cyanobacterium MO_188.B28]